MTTGLEKLEEELEKRHQALILEGDKLASGIGRDGFPSVAITANIVLRKEYDWISKRIREIKKGIT